MNPFDISNKCNQVNFSAYSENCLVHCFFQHALGILVKKMHQFWGGLTPIDRKFSATNASWRAYVTAKLSWIHPIFEQKLASVTHCNICYLKFQVFRDPITIEGEFILDFIWWDFNQDIKKKTHSEKYRPWKSCDSQENFGQKSNLVIVIL